jgi:hypothetical protein
MLASHKKPIEFNDRNLQELRTPIVFQKKMLQKISFETFDCFRKWSNLSEENDSEENVSEELQMFQKNSKSFRRIEFLLHICTGLYADATHMFQKKR